MKIALRNRVILLALVLLIGQLTLVVHATVHDAEINCQLCLSHSHHTKALPAAKLFIPSAGLEAGIFISIETHKLFKSTPKAYFQRAPPVTL